MGKYPTFQEYLDLQRKQAPAVVNYQDPIVRLGTVTSDFNPLGGGSTAGVIFDGEDVVRYLSFGVPVFANDRVTCLKKGNTWQIIGNANTYFNDTRTFTKVIANSKTNNTLTTDTEFSAISLSVGIWDISGVFLCTGVSASNARFRFDFTGTGSGLFAWTGPASGAASDYNNTLMKNNAAPIANDQTFGVNNTGIYAVVRVDSIFTVSGAGNLSVAFSQTTTGTTASVFQVGSLLRIRRVK